MVAKGSATPTVLHKGIAAIVYIYVYPKKIAVAELTWDRVGLYTMEMSV